MRTQDDLDVIKIEFETFYHNTRKGTLFLR